MHVSFISSKDTGETCTINILSDNEEIMWRNESDDIITNLFESFLNNYQREEQIMRRVSNLIFESVDRFKELEREEQRNKLVWEPNYHTTKHFSENLLTIEIKKRKVIMNKPVYLRTVPCTIWPIFSEFFIFCRLISQAFRRVK